MTVEYITTESKGIKASEIPVGTLFTGKIADYNHRLFFIFSNGGVKTVVALDKQNGNEYWTMPAGAFNAGPTIKNYRPVTKLTVED